MKELHKVSRTSALVGAPLTMGEVQLVPLCRLTMGFGTGTSDAAGKALGRGGALEGAGAGGALRSSRARSSSSDPTACRRC